MMTNHVTPHIDVYVVISHTDHSSDESIVVTEASISRDNISDFFIFEWCLRHFSFQWIFEILDVFTSFFELMKQPMRLCCDSTIVMRIEWVLWQSQTCHNINHDEMNWMMFSFSLRRQLFSWSSRWKKNNHSQLNDEDVMIDDSINLILLMINIFVFSIFSNYFEIKI